MGGQESLNCALRADSLGLSRYEAHRPGGRQDPHWDIERPFL
jgi:hypothetical protein